MMHLRVLEPTELGWANAQYTVADFKPSSNADLIVVAVLDGERAGLGRIVPLSDRIGELGGIYVRPEFRGHALAGNIVASLIAMSHCSTLFCLPFSYLAGFYAKHGFVPIGEGDVVPPTVQEKFEWCNAHYSESVQLLVRHTSIARKLL